MLGSVTFLPSVYLYLYIYILWKEKFFLILFKWCVNWINLESKGHFCKNNNKLKSSENVKCNIYNHEQLEKNPNMC